ncbi:MAG: histidine kinase [Bacillota bacterium]
MEKEVKIAELEAALADIRKRWPAHSVKPELINEMERLEEELAKLKNESNGG